MISNSTPDVMQQSFPQKDESLPAISPQQVIRPGVESPDQQFGAGTDLDADTLVIGQDSEPGNDGGPGVVSIYRFEADEWKWVTSFSSPSPNDGDSFEEVAIDGDTLVVGAAGFDGCGNSCESGAVFIYDRNEGGADNWGLVKQLENGTNSFNWFGDSVDLQGNTALAYRRGGTQDGAPNAAVLVFDRNEGGVNNWGFVKLLESNSIPKLGIGPQMTLVGDSAYIVGDAGETVYVFTRDLGGENNWGLEQKIAAPCRVYDIASDGNTLILNVFDGDLPAAERTSAFVVHQKNEEGVWAEVHEWEETFRVLEIDLEGNLMLAHAFSGTSDAAYLYRRDGDADSWMLSTRLASERDPELRYGDAALDSGRAVASYVRAEIDVREYEGVVYYHQAAEPINAGHAGAWYYPPTSGQGEFLDVEPETRFMAIGWFTFTAGDSANPNEQQWYTAQGNFVGNTAELEVNETLGGEFDDPQGVVTKKVGTAMVSFAGCGLGWMSYHLDDGRQGGFPMNRAIPGSENVCQSESGSSTQSQDINAGMDGAWFNENTPGQGFYFDVHLGEDDERSIFVSWFTYGDDTASGLRWFTAQGPFEGSVAAIDIHETTGGSFDDPEAVQTVKVGTMTIDFADCETAELSYTLDDDDLAGDIDITRAIPGTEALCEDLN